MTPGALRVSAVALGSAVLALSSAFSAANAATVTHPYGHAATVAHHYQHAAHPLVAHGVHGYVARGHVGHRHYVWRNGHRYAYYGYNPGAAVAAGVIGGAAAGYPYCGDYSYGTYYGSCNDYSYGYPYPDYDYGFGFGGPVFVGRDHFHHGFHDHFHDHGFPGGAHFASGNFGHTGGFGGGHFGGFGTGHVGGFGGAGFAGGGHMGGFGGGHFGGFGGGHFGGGGHFH